MKIKKEEFWELIKSGEKTIELRKTNYLDNNYYELEMGFYNGRLTLDITSPFKIQSHGFNEKGIEIVSSYTNDLGTIIFNGYEIIKKEWLFKVIVDTINSTDYDNNQEFQDRLDEIIYNDCFGFENCKGWLLKNINWMCDNYDFLQDYFKDEPEILVLKIESWEKS